MASNGSDTSGLYSQVSSLYGPGTMACWYLTALSCLVSWTLQPKTRASDSVGPDFIALLTFPTVAAGHLISQVYFYPGITNEMMITKDLALLKLVAAIEASLNVTETYMFISVTAFIVAIWPRCVKRALLLAFTGLFCFSAEAYLLVSTQNKRDTKYNLSRPFLVNSAGMFIALVVPLTVLIFVATGMKIIFHVRRHASAAVGNVEQENDREIENVAGLNGASELELLERLDRDLELKRMEQTLPENKHVIYISALTTVLLSISAGAIAFPGLLHILSVSSSGGLTWLRAASSRIVQNNFPQTNVSIKELDQVVAILAGTSVFGFSLYSAADARYRLWLEKYEAQNGQNRQQQ